MRFAIRLEVPELSSRKMKADSTKDIINTKIDIRYQNIFLSLLKQGLENAAIEQYKKLYLQDQEKLFSQAIIFHNALFEKNSIQLTTPYITWLWSCPQAETAMAVYNAFAYLKKKKSLKISESLHIRIERISSIFQDPITEKTVDFRLVSPVLARDHNRETKKDWFYGFDDPKFEEVLKENLIHKLVPHLGKGVQYDIEQLKITPIDMKKTVTKVYEKCCQGSIGTLQITGEPYLLNFIRDCGLGSRTGLYFGFLEQLRQGGV
ncbi:MAG: CRISPR-associated endoribonuclease Cas6 [Enterococcaceae bacterium]|jgi:CRISPR-associated endoribonuclease Cas6|nr:CRISPR-associated endoribonuclease Cas6 [Enterococcaceae bacterium]